MKYKTRMSYKDLENNLEVPIGAELITLYYAMGRGIPFVWCVCMGINNGNAFPVAASFVRDFCAKAEAGE